MLMALSIPSCTNFTKFATAKKEKFSLVKSRSCRIVSCQVQCSTSSPNISSDHKNIVRRSANYDPPIWSYDYIQALSSKYLEKSYSKQHHMLKEEVKLMLGKVENHLHQLELANVLQRLGLFYHFKDDMKRILDDIYKSIIDGNHTWKNLCSTALEFRLLRPHGYDVSTEVFKRFHNEMDNLKSYNTSDIEGMLSLYEASYLSIEGETFLDEARDFTRKHLKEFVEDQNKKENEMILQHESYFAEFAKLDFNILQATLQEDLKQASSWWKDSGLGELSFARNRLMENFFWNVGIAWMPHFGYHRRMQTTVFALITTIDDVYDVHGTLEELELFTDVVDRWDSNAMDKLPDYMKTCFLALGDVVDEIAFNSLKEQGFHSTPYLKKQWAGLCKSYLIEAKWYHNGYTPTLQEYIDNAWISIGASLIMFHAYLFVSNPITREALDCLEDNHNIIRWSAMIHELKAGDVAKSMQCYMNEVSGASEKDAHAHVWSLVNKTWKKMNKDRATSSPFCETFTEVAVNFARMALCMYQNGDGHTVQDPKTKNLILSLVIEPIPVTHG
ncbi:Myrcene synthase, chloroplastic [Quillaja saponaria]|uniref:Myrcene synthase, chloroplastic n=1 Tax=Quillaja saponaria TaxID=32244 RepID=A0AAD7QJJ7_QUISA|nr:Myrcene synthase, chloroplastic [Quillaja saponaria]